MKETEAKRLMWEARTPAMVRIEDAAWKRGVKPVKS